MPRLWSQTIDAHRRDVRDAVLDAAAALIGEHGLLAVSMSQLAERAGIGRATLYKYFADIEAVVHAWHERQVAEHVRQLTAARDRHADPAARLRAVLESCAHAARTAGAHGPADAGIVAALHRATHVRRAHDEVALLLTDALTDAAAAGHVRADVPAAELAAYCAHAVGAAGAVPSAAAARRVVELTLAGLRGP